MSAHTLPLSLARKLRDDVYKVTDGQSMKRAVVGEFGLRHPDTPIATLYAALALAIEKGWLAREGETLQSGRQLRPAVASEPRSRSGHDIQCRQTAPQAGFIKICNPSITKARRVLSGLT